MVLVGLTRKGCRTSAVPGEARYVADRTRLRRLLAAGVAATIAGLTLTTQAQAASHQWSIVSSPNGGWFNELKGVSCVSTSFCMAVGYDHQAEPALTMIEEWDGSRWSLVGSPNAGAPSSLPNGFLDAVSCVSTSFCMATGDFEINRPAFSLPTLMEQWDGTTWNLVSSPTASAQGDLPLDVSCVSANFCMAVGLSYRIWPQVLPPLIEKWDGSVWSLVDSPSFGIVCSFLSGVSCLNTSFCMAVGQYHDSTSDSDRPLTEEWNGSSWSQVDSPRSTDLYFALGSVSCTSRSFCIATGASYDASGTSRTLIERWDGRSWSLVNSPKLASGALGSVSCTGRSFCMAVGVNGTFYQTLAEHSDGSSWKLVSSPNAGAPGLLNGFLTGVSCTSKSFCMAVGDYYGPPVGGALTLTEKW